MSNFELLYELTQKDFKKSANAYAERIINANLAHLEYSIAQNTYRVLSDVVLYLESAQDFVLKNPDAELPDTFLPSSPGTPEEHEVKSESTVHKVDIESGTVSRGSH